MWRSWQITGIRQLPKRGTILLALPTLIWTAALLCLFGIVVWTGGADRSPNAGEYCHIERVSSPPGLGQISRSPGSGTTTLELEPKSGRGIAIFEHGGKQIEGCGSLLILANFTIPTGYEVSIFKREVGGGLHRAPIETAWFTASVYDLEQLLPAGLRGAQEWGLSVQPIDANAMKGGTSNRISFSEPALSLPTASAVSAMFMTRWTQFRPWSGQSINVLSDTGNGGFTWRRPTFLVGLSLLLAMAVAILLFRANRRELLLAMVPPVVVSWLVVDVLWQHNLSQQRQETALLYQDDPEPTILADESDRRLAAIAEEVKGLAPNAEAPILVVGPDAFSRARLFYHLLPRNAVMVSHGLGRVHYERSPKRLSDAYVVLVDGSAPEFVAETGQLQAEPDVSIPVKMVASGRDWKLLQISPPPERDQSG